jgi:hypothetical protein
MFMTVQNQVEPVPPEYPQQITSINDSVIASALFNEVRDQDRVMMYKRDANQIIIRRQRPELTVEVSYAVTGYPSSVLVRFGFLHKPGRIDGRDNRTV